MNKYLFRLLYVRTYHMLRKLQKQHKAGHDHFIAHRLSKSVKHHLEILGFTLEQFSVGSGINRHTCTRISWTPELTVIREMS